MKPAEFVELSLNIPICAEMKAYIDKLYLLFISDKHKFIEQISTVPRGSSKTNIIYYLPQIFTMYHEKEEQNAGKN